MFMLEGVLAIVAAAHPARQIRCGDFNLPQLETVEGQIVTWAERVGSAGSLRIRRTRRGQPALRWDQAERSVMQGGNHKILIDAYRYLYGYGRQEFSWFLKRKELMIGRRFDHAFCSPELKVLACEYLHHLREEGLSDHSALNSISTSEPPVERLASPSPPSDSHSASAATVRWPSANVVGDVKDRIRVRASAAPPC